MGETTPQVRVGDRERRAVDEQLLGAVADGVLTLDEYDERSRDLWQARTRGDLAALVEDLPSAAASAAASPAVGQQADRGGGGAQRVVAVLSEDRFAGVLPPGQAVHGWAVLGKAVVDLRREDLCDGVHVRVRAVLGEVEVQVPAGAVVHLSGLSVVGERAVRVADGAGPVVHVDAVAVMGTVQVTHGDGTVVAADRRAGTADLRRPTSVAVPAPRGVGPRERGQRVGPLRHVLSGLAALVVPAGVLAGVLAAGPDSAAVFGSTVERVRDGQDSVAVSTLFGSVTVVVPDDARVDTSGAVVFGSTECDDACGAAPATASSGVLEVRRLGAFGSVEILTESEWDGEQAQDARKDAREEAEEAREEAEEARGED